MDKFQADVFFVHFHRGISCDDNLVIMDLVDNNRNIAMELDVHINFIHESFITQVLVITVECKSIIYVLFSWLSLLSVENIRYLFWICSRILFIYLFFCITSL